MESFVGESAPFGDAKGAFTDASPVECRLKLRVAEGRTLSLVEVDALSLRSQVKLLRFVQDREFRPLGSSETKVANVQRVGATNRDLRKCIEQKSFRENLYHRLNILFLHIPSLRERLRDIPLLSNHLLANYTDQVGASLFEAVPFAGACDGS